MPDIQIQRQHALGLPLAREIARRWTGKLESDFSLRCRYEEGTQDDQVAVSGLGVMGWVVVNARFLKVQLDLRFPLVALRSMIEQRIARELDEELAAHPSAAASSAQDAQGDKAPVAKAPRPRGTAARKVAVRPAAKEAAKTPVKKAPKAAAPASAKRATKAPARKASRAGRP